MRKSSDKAAEAEIKQAREETNRLIAAHDAAGIGQFVTDDVRLIGGAAELFVGRSQVVEAYRTSFADPDFVTYRRDGWRVLLADSGNNASEWGHWEGLWQGESPRRMAGDYHAMWRLLDGRWQIQAELYVCLEPGMPSAFS
jgi:hypothetical protein